MWKRKKSLPVTHDVAAKRARRLSTPDLMDAAQSAMGSVSRSLRSGNLVEAEMYSEVLVVIVREVKSRE
jgi:hypothetical protein